MLKPEVSLGVGLATAAVVYSTFQHAMPSLADVRVAQPQDADIEASRKLAAWTSAGLVGGISLVAKDPTVFVFGGALVVALDWWYRHANEVNPLVKRATGTAGIGVTPTQQSGDMSAGSDVITDY